MFDLTPYQNMTLREWQLSYKNIKKLIVQASVKDGSDSWQPFPIGMQYNYVYHYSKGPIIQIGKHKRLVMCAINDGTDKRRRPRGINRSLILSNLSKNNIENVTFESNKYYDMLPKYKFVISPEGNGIDCHRHYEALIAGCIPIVESNEHIKEKYKGCPILYTQDYNEITEDYLKKKYEEMIDIKYDFSRLFLPFYKPEVKKIIKDCGNYWINHTTKTKWY